MRLDLVNVVANGVDYRAYAIGIELRALALGQQQLGAMEIETRRTAFVHFDMCFFVAHDPAMRRHHRRKRQAVRRSTGCHPQHRAFTLEKRVHLFLKRYAQCVAIVGRIGGIRRTHRIPDRGVNAGGIV